MFAYKTWRKDTRHIWHFSCYINKVHIITLFSHSHQFYKINIIYWRAFSTLDLMDTDVRSRKMTNNPLYGSHCCPHRGMFRSEVSVSLWLWRTAYLTAKGLWRWRLLMNYLGFDHIYNCDLTLIGSFYYSQPQLFKCAFPILKIVEHTEFLSQLKIGSLCSMGCFDLWHFPHHTCNLIGLHVAFLCLLNLDSLKTVIISLSTGELRT